MKKSVEDEDFYQEFEKTKILDIIKKRNKYVIVIDDYDFGVLASHLSHWNDESDKELLDRIKKQVEAQKKMRK